MKVAFLALALALTGTLTVPAMAESTARKIKPLKQPKGKYLVHQGRKSTTPKPVSKAVKHPAVKHATNAKAKPVKTPKRHA